MITDICKFYSWVEASYMSDRVTGGDLDILNFEILCVWMRCWKRWIGTARAEKWGWLKLLWLGVNFLHLKPTRCGGGELGWFRNSGSIFGFGQICSLDSVTNLLLFLLALLRCSWNIFCYDLSVKNPCCHSWAIQGIESSYSRGRGMISAQLSKLYLWPKACCFNFCMPDIPSSILIDL